MSENSVGKIPNLERRGSRYYFHKRVPQHWRLHDGNRMILRCAHAYANSETIEPGNQWQEVDALKVNSC